jgi:hypothetical protein
MKLRTKKVMENNKHVILCGEGIPSLIMHFF